METVEHLIESGLGQSQGVSASVKEGAVFTPADAILSMIAASRTPSLRPKRAMAQT